ncbi:MAG: DUF559 domain-containing protein, partial [Hyphomicrobiales bacterium]|nr:DUF559 domain-containing protein [Hyphomicrobiales bacterium]
MAVLACFEARLIIEVDRATLSTEPESLRDAARSARLAARGFDVLGFTNDVFAISRPRGNGQNWSAPPTEKPMPYRIPAELIAKENLRLAAAQDEDYAALGKRLKRAGVDIEAIADQVAR